MRVSVRMNAWCVCIYTETDHNKGCSGNIIYGLDVPLVELCTLYLLACQVRVTVGDSTFCCRVAVYSHVC